MAKKEPLKDREPVLLRMPTDLIEKVKTRAEKTHRSYNMEIIWIVQRFLAREEQGEVFPPSKEELIDFVQEQCELFLNSHG